MNVLNAVVEWKEKLQFIASSGSGHRLTIDGAPEFGGENRGPRPTELVLMGLGGCTSMDVVMILQKMRVDLQKYSVELEAERAADHPKVFTKIRMVYHVWGHEIPPDKVERAVQLTQEKYCGVLHMLNKTAEIEFSYQIHPLPPSSGGQ